MSLFAAPGVPNTSYYYDGSHIIEETFSDGRNRDYLWGTNGEMLRGANSSSALDGFGNIVQTTDVSQTLATSTIFDGFGVIWSMTGSPATDMDWNADSDYVADRTGSPSGNYAIIKVGARYLDQATGSFLTRDTYIDQSPYAYCDGDPINYEDPTGHKDGKKDPPKKSGDGFWQQVGNFLGNLFGFGGSGGGAEAGSHSGGVYYKGGSTTTTYSPNGTKTVTTNGPTWQVKLPTVQFHFSWPPITLSPP